MQDHPDSEAHHKDSWMIWMIWELSAESFLLLEVNKYKLKFKLKVKKNLK